MALSEILTALSLLAVSATLWLFCGHGRKWAGPPRKTAISVNRPLQPALVPQRDRTHRGRVPRRQRVCSR